jgi:hypothetical protein
MHLVESLVQDVAVARARYLDALGTPSPAQAAFSPGADAWSLVQITEHMTLAEQVGINGIWKALEGYRVGSPVWTGDPVHRGRPIEEIIGSTWREREVVPAVAAPKWSGPLPYWVAALRGCQPVLEALGRELAGVDLAAVVYPHPISGPLDARQRLEFLRFHLDRHAAQVVRVREADGFPTS